MAGTHVISPNQLASLHSSERKDIKKDMCTSLSVCLTLALPQRQLTRIISNYIHFTVLNMNNEPYSKLKDGSMCLSKVTRKLKF